MCVVSRTSGDRPGDGHRGFSPLDRQSSRRCQHAGRTRHTSVTAIDDDREAVVCSLDERGHLAYFPFSAEPQRCVGDRFAMLEARLVLATLLQDYHLELVSGPELDLVATITARPRDPVRMRVHERD